MKKVGLTVDNKREKQNTSRIDLKVRCGQDERPRINIGNSCDFLIDTSIQSAREKTARDSHAFEKATNDRGITDGPTIQVWNSDNRPSVCAERDRFVQSLASRLSVTFSEQFPTKGRVQSCEPSLLPFAI